ncbi:MAG: polyprenyl synthetase family protein [Coriobacteriia bacterium]|nr:polyprenyl synthetase family protein [Coriobacteriia bacterium]
MTFEEYLKDYAKKITPDVLAGLDRVRNNFEDKKHPDVDKYLYNPFKKYISNPGKLHRPLTCIAAYKACGGEDIERIIPIAITIENFQSAALIHDDIADGASLRRSKPCMHIVEGEPIAINIGDMGLAMVLGSVIDEDKEILRELTRMEYMTIEGQAMDLGWARDNRYDITEEDYFCMATKKTAYYSVATPCVLGALCATSKDIDKFREFGLKLGLAFQLKDDLLNIVGDANDKDFRSDIDEGKRTLILVKTIEELGLDILNKSRDEIAEAMIECGAVKYVEDKAIKLASVARDILDNINLNEWKEIFYSMCDWVTSRKV